MLEKYLTEKGITIADISAKYPDLASLAEKYISISALGDDEYKTELEEIGNEILEKIKEKEAEIKVPVKEEPVKEEPVKEPVKPPPPEVPEEPAEVPVTEIPEIIELPEVIPMEALEEAPVVEEKKPLGYFYKNIEFSRDGFMKVLTFLNIGCIWKEKESNEKQKFWIIDDKNYLITEGENPFAGKVDLYAVAEPQRRDEITSVIQSKSIGYDEKYEITTAPDLSGLKMGVTTDDKEPITNLSYAKISETIKDLYRVESTPELVTLMELSAGKKYACGCGHI